MITCKSCGAEVSPEKAWCPHCNQPLEAETKRAVVSEMDTFDGTLYEKKKPRPVALPEVQPSAPAPDRSVVAASPVSPVAAPGAVTDAPLKPRRPTWVYLLGGVLIGLVLLMLLAFGGALAYYLLT